MLRLFLMFRLSLNKQLNKVCILRSYLDKNTYLQLIAQVLLYKLT